MIFEQVQNWAGGINARETRLRKLEYSILLRLFVRINYCNANDIIYIIYMYVCVLDRFWIENVV